MTTLHRSDFISIRDLLMAYERFPESICDGCMMLTGDAYFSGHLVPYYLGLAYVLLVETNPFLELVVIFPDYALRISLGTLSVLLFASLTIFTTPRLCILLSATTSKTQSLGVEKMVFSVHWEKSLTEHITIRYHCFQSLHLQKLLGSCEINTL